MPGEDDNDMSAEEVKKRRDKYWRDNKKKGVRPIRCIAVHSKGQCKKLCWGPKCTLHAGRDEEQDEEQDAVDEM